MDRRQVAAVMAISLGSALLVLGGFLRWWMPEESEGWPPFIVGLALLGTGALGLSTPTPRRLTYSVAPDGRKQLHTPVDRQVHGGRLVSPRGLPQADSGEPMVKPQPTAAKGWSNPCVPQKMTKGKAEVRVWHVAAPTCFWSWGFEGTLHRIRLRYGNQVDLRIIPAVVHTDLKEWMHHNELTTPKSMDAWAVAASKEMGVPIWTAYSKLKIPSDQTPATRAVVAAFRQGQPQGERLMRELLRRNVVEGKNVTMKAVILSAAKASGLDVKRLERDLKDAAALDADAERMGDGAPHAPLGFYNLIVEDGSGRTILIDYAFDPKPVEEAIEFLTARRLKKNTPTDPAAFLAAAGPTHAVELGRAFGWPADRVKREMAKLEKKAIVRQVELAGHPYWAAK